MTDESPGTKAWSEQTSAFDRVRSVANTLSQPRPVSYIAGEAKVAETTARAHLERLVDLGILLKSDDEGLTRYSPDPLYTRTQAVRDLLEEYDRDALVRQKSELRDQIETWQGDYEVESLDELRERAATTDSADETRAVLQTVNNWKLVTHRLGIIKEAIENYTRYGCHYRSSE
ncbi:ArsR family transcriptional regulator [Halarchaeum sp. CBA1220]|uniref:DUF7342 family protein n=1 Tax=Halarchaeum sp. CBA1220 TaxID=1853682 RepID=UPI000F3A8DDA|nr:ArsR family transcriptional regulator [Halarchaeum sp. CBA1220]QLC34363.1 ArsR family transcriptional regulator [Halarchaeum sp. CBA1220]